MGKNITGPRRACGLEWPNLSAGTIQHSHIVLSWLLVRKWKIMPDWIFFLIWQFECKTVFWPCLSVRTFVPSNTWLQSNTSLSLGPRSFIKALLTTLWPLLAFSSWPYKSVGLFSFPMEMVVVLFKYFPFCQYSPPSANFNWSEQSKWIHSPAGLCLSEFLQEEEEKLKKTNWGSIWAMWQHSCPAAPQSWRRPSVQRFNMSLKGIDKCTILKLAEMHRF